MWQVETSTTPFRQGDVLEDFPFPSMDASQPIKSGPNHGDGQYIALGIKRLNVLVVSQCCEAEPHLSLALAPIKRSYPIDQERLPGWRAVDPSANAGYVFDQFVLEPLTGVIPDDEQTKRGLKLTVADLARLVTLEVKNVNVNQYSILARMSPWGRRCLRVNLALFFGRAEKEDAASLLAAGLPVGTARAE